MVYTVGYNVNGEMGNGTVQKSNKTMVYKQKKKKL